MRRNFKKELQKYCNILINSKIEREEKLQLLDRITFLISSTKTTEILQEIDKLEFYINLLKYNYLIDKLDENLDWVPINGADTTQEIYDILNNLDCNETHYRILERIKEQTVLFEFINSKYQLDLFKENYLTNQKQKYYAKYYKGVHK